MQCKQKFNISFLKKTVILFTFWRGLLLNNCYCTTVKIKIIAELAQVNNVPFGEINCLIQWLDITMKTRGLVKIKQNIYSKIRQPFARLKVSQNVSLHVFFLDGIPCYIKLVLLLYNKNKNLHLLLVLLFHKLSLTL